MTHKKPDSHTAIARQIEDVLLETTQNVQQVIVSHHALKTVANALLALTIPALRSGQETTEHLAEKICSNLSVVLSIELAPDSFAEKQDSLWACLPFLAREVHEDCVATLAADPSTDSLTSVSLSYPGPKALALYRLAHRLWEVGAKISARALTEFGHEITGIDIHPGAKIGKSIAIDHGTGIVIGETSVVGNNVTLYHGVTLGNLSVHKSQAGHKRHPTVEDNCTLYAHATILGGETVIGKGSTIGGGVWVTKSVPANSQVVVEHPYSITAKS